MSENRATGNGSGSGDLVEIGNGRPPAGDVCIIEWAAHWRERCLDGRILGVVSHVIKPETRVVPLA